MKRSFAIVAALVATLATGCASTRGGQDIACDDFDKYAFTPAPSGFVQDIQRYAPGGENGLAAAESAGASPLDTLITREVFGTTPAAADAAANASGAEAIVVERPFPMRNLLLLSGGGQWGAYGAGLFLGLVCRQDPVPADRKQTPCLGENRQIITQGANGDPLLDFTPLDEMNIGLITGVSTGGLQAMLLMAVLDKGQTDKARTAALQQLLTSYAPESEDVLVDRGGFESVIITGSVAGTDPLRGHVRDVLTMKFPFRDAIRDPETQAITGYTPEEDRRLIDQIGKSPITTVVGIVEGTDGQFKYVDMKAMVKKIALEERLARLRGGDADEEEDDEPSVDKATRCALATTMASAAMPVFHQQLRVLQATAASGEEPTIDERTLFDGGVRRSVFVSEIGDIFRTRYSSLTGKMSDATYNKALRDGTLPRVFVLRNGPTTSKVARDVDDVSTAIPQAMRAYSLLVNELEVGSIASLRLANPYGPIEVSTADGAEQDEAPSNGSTDAIRRLACTKEEQMFKPEFMRCLQNFGARRGMELEMDARGDPIPAFWDLRPIAKRPPPDDSGADTQPSDP
ncbi:MAG: patatin-like phospholipase family protein [Pseudomonadota bacterium]